MAAAPRLRERFVDGVERAREAGQALGRRLAQPPRGGHALRWAASWVAYAALLAALVWVWAAHPPLVVWIVVFVIAGEVSLPVEAGHGLRHWGFVGILYLAASMVLSYAFHARTADLVMGALVPVVLIAGGINPAPLRQVVWWAERLGVWALVLWGWFIVFLLVSAAGLSLLHPVVAALDPPYRPVFDAIVNGAAFTVSAAAAAVAILAVFRWHARRVEGA